MTNTEFKTKLVRAFKGHIFTKGRDCHTVNELLYVLQHDSEFNGEDFNVSIRNIGGYYTSIPWLDAFVGTQVRGMWFNDADVEFEVEETGEEKYNCITVYERKENKATREKFEVTKQIISDDIMESLRERRGLDCMDESQDAEILKMNSWEFLDEWLNYQGIIGYTSDIIEVVGCAFGIDLIEHSLDETPEREI